MSTTHQRKPRMPLPLVAVPNNNNGNDDKTKSHDVPIVSAYGRRRFSVLGMIALTMGLGMTFMMSNSMMSLSVVSSEASTTKSTCRKQESLLSSFPTFASMMSTQKDDNKKETQTYTGAWKLQQQLPTELPPAFPTLTKSCDLWAVVTSIFAPNDAVRSVVGKHFPDSDWCMVIVGDAKSPPSYSLNQGSNNYFLSLEQQQTILKDIALVQLMPENDFARKNIGFLFAVAHGAKVIYDFDDDNIFKEWEFEGHDDNNKERTYMAPFVPMAARQGDNGSMLVRYVEDPPHHAAFNPLPYMGPSDPDIWPRGFPLDIIKESVDPSTLSKIKHGSLSYDSIGVIQAVCDKDPDVDALYRLTRPLPVHFDSQPSTAQRLLVPPNKYASYNAQATTHYYKAFWGLLMPITTTPRVLDIWRAYYVQRIFQDVGLALVYEPPLVEHDRSPHSYLKDMYLEHDLYFKAGDLIQFLDEWEDSSPTLPAKLEKLWIALYEQGFLGIQDVQVMQEWLLALLAVGYEFPVPHKSKQISLVEEPSLHDQPFLSHPQYNFGAEGLTYPDYLAGRKGTQELWDSWLAGSQKYTSRRPSNRLIVKLVLMVKDEWSLTKHWILYHGEIFGFEHLYVIDGSTDRASQSFLRFARDTLGVNVIFSKADQRTLGAEMTKILDHVRSACDFVLKMDTDEYLVWNTGQADCRHGNNGQGVTNCTLSPFGLSEALSTSAQTLLEVADKNQLRIGHHWGSRPSRRLCESGEHNDIGQFRFAPSGVSGYKMILDARGTSGIDLGGHRGRKLKPYNDFPTIFADLSILHFHFRCWETEIANNLKSIVGEGYLLESDSKEVALAKLLPLLQTQDPCSVPTMSDLKQCVSSCHKVLFHAKYLLGCISPDTFYPSAEKEALHASNPDFAHFLASVSAKYL